MIDSGSLASGAGASISTSGGVVSLTVAIIAPTSGRWTNLPGGSWPIAGNWLNGAVASGSGNTADFSTLTLTADTAVTLDWPRTIGNLLFDDQNTTKHAWTLNPGSGAGALTLAVSSGSPVISNNVPTTVGTVIAGANGLTKSGAGALFLTGANTYGGGTTISGTGTLLLTNDAALGNASGGLAFSASGTINPTNNDVTLGAGRTVTISSGITATFGVSDVNTLYVASFITGPGSVAKGGSSYSLGWVCFTNDANNYTGDFSTSCGNLQFTSVAEQGTPSSLGAGAAATGGRITLANSISYGSLRYVGVGNSATHRPLYWTANGNIFALDNTGAGTIAYLATTQMVSGAGAKILTLQGSNTGTNTLAQAIGDSGGATTVSKSGAGTWILSGTNTYSGGTTIGAGTLAISGHGSIGASGNLTIAAGATLDVSGATGGYTLGTGQTLVAGNGTSLVNGNLSLGGAALALFWTNGVPSLTISSNVLTMNNNATTVTVAGSAPLAVGGYKIISKGAGGSVSGAVSNSPVNVAGAGAGAVASLQITSGELYLNVVNGNGPPIANAGPDQKFGAGPIASVTLDASGSSDPRNRPLTYHWSQLSGWKVQLSNTNAVQPTFSYPWPGTYVFQLVVNDGLQDSAPALVGVVVGARAPVANAGPSFYVFTNSVTLDGTRSYEPDGYGALTCQWRQVSGPAVTLTGTNTPNPVVSGFTPTGTIQTCLFSLVVSDSLFASQPSTVTVTIVRNYNPNVLTLAVPPFDTNKPTVLMFGGGNCDTGSGGTWVGGTIPWTNLVNWITVGTYTDNYTSYGDMFAAYLSSVAPHYQKPIQTIGFSTGNYPAMEAAWYINSTFNDPRYAVNRVALLDAVCDNIDSYISQFVASPVAGGQCWVDSYISGDPNYATAKSYAGALNVKYIPHNTHGGVPDAYSGETWAPTAGTNFANAGLVAHAYLSVVGNGKNYQLNSAAQKYFFSDNPTNGVVSFYNQATYPGLMMSPVNLSGPANGATIATNGTSLGCGIVTNATQYQLLLGTNASRVMADYTVLLTTNAPPHQTITNLPGTNAWWTVLASDAYGSTIYADPRLIVRPANCPPVAVAGTNQAVVANTNGIAMVTLNGSKSTELNGIVQSYTWAWAVGTNSYLTNGVSPTIALPIGVYTIQLMVNDGQVNSQPAAVTITVVPLSPIIVLVAPTNNAVFAAPATIGLLATVTTNGNTINSVSFYNWGTNLIASVSPAPYAYSWTNVSAGVYSLSACLAYNNGSTVNSGPARLILAAQPAVTSPRFNYGAFGITFTTELGPVYEVEYQNVLGGPVWQLLTNVAGTSLPVTVTDNAATNTSRFYRLQVQ